MSASPPSGRNAYVHALESGVADLFLTYRSNARAAIADHGGLGTMRALALPADLTIEDFGSARDTFVDLACEPAPAGDPF